MDGNHESDLEQVMGMQTLDPTTARGRTSRARRGHGSATNRDAGPAVVSGVLMKHHRQGLDGRNSLSRSWRLEVRDPGFGPGGSS